MPEVRKVASVGGTKNVHLEQVLALNPTLVLASKEENQRSQVSAIAGHCPVYVTDVDCPSAAYDMIRQIGALTGKEGPAAALAGLIDAQFEQLAKISTEAVYLIWKDPWMAAGGGTYIHSLMAMLGMANRFGHLPRYPQIDLAQLEQLAPVWVLLSSEPYPFGQAHRLELQARLPYSRVMLVDGEMFSWYGSRMLLAATYFEQLVHAMA
jgi:ABC-type Fe3+-hydroxamate transport system substrate-binding protein